MGAKRVDVDFVVRTYLDLAHKDRLMDLDPGQVELLYRQGDEFIRSAIESAPPRIIAKNGVAFARPLISPDVVAETRTAQAMAEAGPQLGTDLRDLDAVAMALTQVAGALKGGISSTVNHLGLGAPPSGFTRPDGTPVG